MRVQHQCTDTLGLAIAASPDRCHAQVADHGGVFPPTQTLGMRQCCSRQVVGEISFMWSALRCLQSRRSLPAAPGLVLDHSEFSQGPQRLSLISLHMLGVSSNTTFRVPAAALIVRPTHRSSVAFTFAWGRRTAKKRVTRGGCFSHFLFGTLPPPPSNCCTGWPLFKNHNTKQISRTSGRFWVWHPSARSSATICLLPCSDEQNQESCRKNLTPGPGHPPLLPGRVLGFAQGKECVPDLQCSITAQCPCMVRTPMLSVPVVLPSSCCRSPAWEALFPCRRVHQAQHRGIFA